MVKKRFFKRSGGYIQRYEVMLASDAYRNLSPAARCLLEEFQRIYRPDRNGILSIGTRKAAELLRVSEPTAMKAFDDLVSHGFLELKNHHSWTQRKAREWTITFEPMNNREPTDEWNYWCPEKPYPVPGRKKSSTKETGAGLQKKQGQTAKNIGAARDIYQKPQNRPAAKSMT
jgi:hypothetical protein